MNNRMTQEWLMKIQGGISGRTRSDPEIPAPVPRRHQGRCSGRVWAGGPGHCALAHYAEKSLDHLAALARQSVSQGGVQKRTRHATDPA